MVMSEHEDQTCAVSSQSQRQPRTYSPGVMSAGIFNVSMTITVVGQLPEHSLGSVPIRALGLVGAGMGVWPEHGAGKNPAPAPAGIGFMAHVLPSGNVPSDTKVPWKYASVPFAHLKRVKPENGMGIFWKQASVNGSDFGQRRYW